MAEMYESIDGWFNFRGAYERALQLPVVPKPVWVEIGAWKGKSTVYMMERLLEEGRDDVDFYTVDHFQGGPEHDVQGDEILEEFKRNAADLLDQTDSRVIVKDSVEAAGLFQPEEVQFILLDGNHYFEAVLADIMAWWPKISPGGMIAFDDWYLDLDPMYWCSVKFGVMSALRQLGHKGNVTVAGDKNWPYAFAIKE